MAKKLIPFLFVCLVTMVTLPGWAQDPCKPALDASGNFTGNFTQWLSGELRCTADTYTSQRFLEERQANKKPGFNKGAFARNFQLKIVLGFEKYGVNLPHDYLQDKEFVAELRRQADALEAK